MPKVSADGCQNAADSFIAVGTTFNVVIHLNISKMCVGSSPLSLCHI